MSRFTAVKNFNGQIFAICRKNFSPNFFLIFSSELIHPKIFQSWKFLLTSGNDFYVSAVTPRNILEILKRKKFIYTKILAVLRIDDVLGYEKFLQVCTLIHLKISSIPSKITPFFLQLSQNVEFSPLIWAVLISQINLAIFDNISVPFDRQFIIAQGNGFSGYELMETYEAGSKKFRKYFGSWSKETGLTAPFLNIFLRRKNFMGSEITISSIGNGQPE